MIANRIKHGIVGGLIGGVVFGLVLGLAYSRGDNCLVLKAGKKVDEAAAGKPDLRSVNGPRACWISSGAGVSTSPRFPSFVLIID